MARCAGAERLSAALGSGSLAYFWRGKSTAETGGVPAGSARAPGGEIDAFLREQQLDRIPGPHCYEMFLGPAEFEGEMERELGTFFLTDYMVRHFERIIMQGMGLRQYPELRDL